MNTASKLLCNGIARLSLLALAASLGCSASVANADESNAWSAPAVTVRYDDLNLDTVAGSKALYARIVSAAETVCAPSTGNFSATLAAHRCRMGAIARAVSDVHNEKFTALYRPGSNHG